MRRLDGIRERLAPRQPALLFWSDVNLEKRTAILRRVKNSRRPDEKRDIKVGLSPHAVEVLRSLPRPKDEPRVFSISKDVLKSAFERARIRAGVEHFNLHDARHERVSSLVEAGWKDAEIMAQTGHLDPKSMLRYMARFMTLLHFQNVRRIGLQTNRARTSRLACRRRRK